MDDVRAWFDGVHPIVVVEDEGGASSRLRRRRPIVLATATPASPSFRSTSRAPSAAAAPAGSPWSALIAAAAQAGFWKLVSRIFVENTASRTLMARVGFREVGIYEKHGKLDGVWRDVVIVERVIPENVR